MVTQKVLTATLMVLQMICKAIKVRTLSTRQSEQTEQTARVAAGAEWSRPGASVQREQTGSGAAPDKITVPAKNTLRTVSAKHWYSD